MTTPDHIQGPPLRDDGPLETMAGAAHTALMAVKGITRDHVEGRMAAVVTALREAGYAIVPRGVTPELLNVIDDEAPAVGCCTLDRRSATEIYELMVHHASISTVNQSLGAPIDTKEGE
jgi:hypothetical protein